MKTFLRRIFRLSLLIPWLLYVGAISLPVSYQKDRWKAIREMARMIKYWGAGLLRIFAVRLEVHGDISSYKGGLIVSNHLGYLDVFVHSAVFGLRFAPKSDIRSWPFIGWYTGLTHPVWVDRSPRSKKSIGTLAEFKETLVRGVPLIVYPEGTSTDGRSGVRTFKTTPFEMVAGSASEVIHPILTFYSVPEGCPTPCWFGDAELVPHLWELVGIPQIKADVYILEPLPAAGMDRRELAEKLHSTIQDAYDKYSPHGKNAR